MSNPGRRDAFLLACYSPASQFSLLRLLTFEPACTHPVDRVAPTQKPARLSVCNKQAAAFGARDEADNTADVNTRSKLYQRSLVSVSRVAQCDGGLFQTVSLKFESSPGEETPDDMAS